jgi:phosphate starvation-inducible protein PhoH
MRSKRSQKNPENKHVSRQLRGEQQLQEDQQKREFGNDWNLGWFEPRGLQNEIIESIDSNTFTIVDGPSGSGKTSVALWKALLELRSSNYHKLIFIKNPTEVGDDKIGFLSGDEQDKLQAHYASTKGIFNNFISPQKLECDLGKKIQLLIPNFLLGATLDHSIVIIDENQLMSPQTTKLLLERCGKYTKYIILGDANQRYAISNRVDGFTDLIQRATLEWQGIRIPRDGGVFGYIKMTRDDNQRSAGSKYINKLYDDED